MNHSHNTSRFNILIINNTYDLYQLINQLFKDFKYNELIKDWQLINLIEERQYELITFDSSIDSLIINLFDNHNLNKLKQLIMKSYVDKYKNNDLITEYPLIINYIYYKYMNSLLISEPSDALIIHNDDIHQIINQLVSQSKLIID